MRFPDEAAADLVEWTAADGVVDSETDALVQMLPTGVLIVFGERKLALGPGWMVTFSADTELLEEDATEVGQGSKEQSFRQAVLGAWEDAPDLWLDHAQICSWLGLIEPMDTSRVKKTLAYLVAHGQLQRELGKRGMLPRHAPLERDGGPEPMTHDQRDVRLAEVEVSQGPGRRDREREAWWNGTAREA